MGEKVKQKQKNKNKKSGGGSLRRGIRAPPFTPRGQSIARPPSLADFCSCFIPLLFSVFVFVFVFALCPTTEPVLRQTLFFPFQILLQIIAARKGNANVRVPA